MNSKFFFSSRESQILYDFLSKLSDLNRERSVHANIDRIRQKFAPKARYVLIPHPQKQLLLSFIERTLDEIRPKEDEEDKDQRRKEAEEEFQRIKSRLTFIRPEGL